MKDEHKLTIKGLAKIDRPREKLAQKGKASLSDAELLAILIGSGSPSETAVQLCQRILKQYDDNLHELAKRSITDLTRFKGVGEAKAITIIAALELGARRNSEEVLKRKQITGSKDAAKLMQGVIGDLPYEEFWVVYLNRANKVIQQTCIGRGGISATVADLRIIVKHALDCFASSMILCHNHPSGRLVPSAEDKRLTAKVVEAVKLFDITILDHVIVSQSSYYSFADEGML